MALKLTASALLICSRPCILLGIQRLHKEVNEGPLPMPSPCLDRSSFAGGNPPLCHGVGLWVNDHLEDTEVGYLGKLTLP